MTVEINQPEFYTRADLAKRLGIHTRTLDYHLKNNIIRAYKFGGSVRFKRTDVEEYIENSLKPTV